MLRCYLQKRILNTSRGPAVRALRAQTDKREYAMQMREIVERQVSIKCFCLILSSVHFTGSSRASKFLFFFPFFHIKHLVHGNLYLSYSFPIFYLWLINYFVFWFMFCCSLSVSLSFSWILGL